MSWNNDGSAELNDAIGGVGAMSDELIAKKLQEWSSDGCQIGYGDFVEREYLRVAAVRLMNAGQNVMPGI